MDLNKLKFKVSDNGLLSDEEKKFLLDAYRKLFIKIYGYDIVNTFLEKNNSNGIEYKPKKRVSSDIIKAIDVLDSLKENDLSLLLIYSENNNLIGAGRLKQINDQIASVPDIAIEVSNEEEKREIWKMAVSYAEKYFLEAGYEKMYLEVPFKDAPLLFRADDLGFKEDPNDIVVSDTVRTYLLNKELVRNKNEEFNSGRK